VALNQCLNFFARNPRIERIPFYDTAGSVKMIAEEKLTDAAAIASSVAAEIMAPAFSADRLKTTAGILPGFFFSERLNTRAAIRSGLTGAPLENLAGVQHAQRSGVAVPRLSAFALRDLNLIKIESRPLRGKPWEYLFYLDFLGRADSPNAQNALNHCGNWRTFAGTGLLSQGA